MSACGSSWKEGEEDGPTLGGRERAVESRAVHPSWGT